MRLGLYPRYNKIYATEKYDLLLTHCLISPLFFPFWRTNQIMSCHTLTVFSIQNGAFLKSKYHGYHENQF